jgi:hypothetical protein
MLKDGMDMIETRYTFGCKLPMLWNFEREFFETRSRRFSLHPKIKDDTNTAFSQGQLWRALLELGLKFWITPS